MTSGKRLDHIHGLRGIAALMVVIQHAFEMAHMGGSNLFDPFLAHVNFGRFGVVLFFLISGLVVPFSFKGERPLRSFALSRFFRLYPAYWLSIGLFVAIAFWEGAPIPVTNVLANLTMVQTFLGVPNIGNAYWTLYYELIFYGMCVLLCAGGMLRSAPVVGSIGMLCLVGCIAPMFGPSPGEVIVVLYLFSLFFIGMVLRLAFIERDARARTWAAVLVCAGTLTGLAMGGAFIPVYENSNAMFSRFALASAMAGPIPLMVLALWLKPAPAKWLMYLGTVSYSIYLFQQPVLDFTTRILSPKVLPLAFPLVVAAAVVAAAGLVYRWIELPMLELGKRLDRRQGSPAAEALPAG